MTSKSPAGTRIFQAKSSSSFSRERVLVGDCTSYEAERHPLAAQFAQPPALFFCSREREAIFISIAAGWLIPPSIIYLAPKNEPAVSLLNAHDAVCLYNTTPRAKASRHFCGEDRVPRLGVLSWWSAAGTGRVGVAAPVLRGMICRAR